ncbi:AAA family ATPase [Klebsiella pneumoniae]|uniref:AAA family ATPase n=1 Tax=Klebsiella pneumoniae TaxID=573 RepID=UPI00388D9D04
MNAYDVSNQRAWPFPKTKSFVSRSSRTGKTLTASALAGELGIPLFQVRFDALITKFMGETASKLRQVFDAIADIRGVCFFSMSLMLSAPNAASQMM